jgi:sterol desaturase/sphingolipid hydroxylase (fatty acid hydroxylase superfamily)
VSELLEIARAVALKALAAWSRPEAWGSVAVLVVLVVLTPRLSGRGTLAEAVRSPGFRTDALYVLFYLGGFFSFLVSAPLQRALHGAASRLLPGLRLDLLAAWPAWLQFALLFVVMDLMNYVAHRLSHRVRLLWLFHAIHHSQPRLTAFTNFRFHLGDILFRMLVQFPAYVLLGSPTLAGVPLVWLTVLSSVLLEGLAHCDLGWRFGPLGALLVSPAFHRIHHSVEARHRDRNFGIALSVWDRLFGTAADDRERPAAYGLEEPQVPESFVRQIPFPLVEAARGRPRP